jgi:hypothetical protein
MVPIEYDKAFFANPHPTYARLRAQAPANWSPDDAATRRPDPPTGI